MNDWICLVKPDLALLKVGAFQCPHCKRVVIAFSSDDNEKQPNIKNYSFCPHCGKKVTKINNDGWSVV